MTKWTKYVKSILLALWYLLAALILLLAVLSALIKAATPILNQHKGQVEALLAKQLHQTIHIDKIQARWANVGPEFHFTSIDIVRNKQTFLHAEALVIHLDVLRSIINKQLVFRALILDKTQLNLVETAPQQYRLNGFDLSSHGTPFRLDKLLAWLGQQNQLTLQQVLLNFTPYKGKATSALLSNAVLYQTGVQQYICTADGGLLAAKPHNLTITNPESHFHLVSHLTGQFKPLSHLHGETYLSLQHMPATALSYLIKHQDLAITDGMIDASIWLHHTGFNLKRLTAQLAASNLVLAQPKQIILDKLVTTLQLSPEAAINLESNNLVHSVNSINSGNSADLSTWHMLADTALLQLHAKQWLKQPVALKLTDVHTELSGRPKQAQFIINSGVGSVSSSALFEQALAFSHSTVSGSWVINPQQLNLQFNQIQANNRFVQAAGQLFLTLPTFTNNRHVLDTQHGLISLVAGMSGHDSVAMKHSLPINLLPNSVKTWLDQAIQSGQGGVGTIVLRGPLTQLPYTAHQGSFNITAIMAPLTFSFAKQWPSLEQLQGKLEINHQALSAEISHAKTAGVAIQSAKIMMTSYLKQPKLILSGQLHASGTDALDYVAQSPLQQYTGSYLDHLSIVGDLSAKLNLRLPLLQLDAAHIHPKGELQFHHNKLNWVMSNQQAHSNAKFKSKPKVIGLTQLNGKITFDAEQLSSDQLSAQFAGLPWQMSIKPVQQKHHLISNTLNATGYIDREALASLLALVPSTSQPMNTKFDLNSYVDGKAKVQASLSIPAAKSTEQTIEQTINFSLNSDLVGMALHLPQPFAKSQQQAKALAISANYQPKSDSGQLALDYQGTINTALTVQHVLSQQQYQWQLAAHLPSLTWPWYQVGVKANSNSGSSSNISSLGKYQHWLDHAAGMTLKIDHLQLAHYPIDQLSIQMQPQQQALLWDITSSIGVGQLTLPKASVASDEPVKVHFSQLHIPPTTVKPKTIKSHATNQINKSRAAINPWSLKSWRPIELLIDDFSYKTYYLGKIVAKTSPMINGISLKLLQVTNPLYQLQLSGQWEQLGQQQTSHFKGDFNTNDLGKVLIANHLTSATIQARQTKLHMDVSWPNAPWLVKLADLTGPVTLSIDDGVIPLDDNTATKMGVGKVLSLFSAQSIERRLRLDFSDLSDSGYSFNTLKTAWNLTQGNAYVDQGKFNGPEAKIDFSGRIGLVQRDYDLSMIITPYLTSTLPVIAAFAGGPIVGVAAYAADKLAGDSIAELTSYHYSLSGPWSAPKLMNLDAQASEQAGAGTSAANTSSNNNNNKLNNAANSFHRHNFS